MKDHFYSHELNCARSRSVQIAFLVFASVLSLASVAACSESADPATQQVADTAIPATTEAPTTTATHEPKDEIVTPSPTSTPLPTSTTVPTPEPTKELPTAEPTATSTAVSKVTSTPVPTPLPTVIPIVASPTEVPTIPPPTATATQTPPTATPVNIIDLELADQGASIYQTSCAGCHSRGTNTVVGPGHANVFETAKSRVDGLSPEDYLRESILNSTAFVFQGFGPIMPSFNFTEEQIQALIEYLKTL